MTNPSWGTKRNCPSCSAHFYDLNKTPAVCPKCSHSFDPSVQTKGRRKSAKRDSSDERNVEITATILPGKKTPSKKRDNKHSNDDDDMGEISEIEDVDDIDNLAELSELEEIEESPNNEDDADEEALIEDMEDGDGTLVDNIADEEAHALSEELADEMEDEEEKTSRKKKSKE